MNYWILVSLALAIVIVILLFRMNNKTRDYGRLERQEKMAWMLKVALEKTFELPTVEAKELAAIEPQIEQIANAPGSDEEMEEKMRLAVMELYAKKAERGGKKGDLILRVKSKNREV
jgi:hypothetical protein